MLRTSRRSFLKGSLATAAVTGWSAQSWSQVAGANNAVRVGVVGLNGRGRDHLALLRKTSGVRIAALCDVDRQVLYRETNEAKKLGETVKTFTDVRELLASRDIDAITIATPNHWHALLTIWACQAGKDVYVEKPVSHNVWEGRQMVNAARKYGRVVQTGTQSRSSEALTAAIGFLRSGKLGRIILARGLCYKRRPALGRVNGSQLVPYSVDYDLWSGPAPKSSLKRYRLHYDWHWFWETGNGDIGNQGVHQMDIARWALGYDSLPGAVASLGGRFGEADDAQTPNTQLAMYYYQPAPIVFEVRGLPEQRGSAVMPKYADTAIGVIIHCTNGHLRLVSNEAFAYDTQGTLLRHFPATNDPAQSHFANFIHCVRDHQPSALKAGILEGHLSSALGHLGNISYRLGHTGEHGEIQEKLSDEPATREAFGRMTEHLAANQINPASQPTVIGPWLKFDADREQFLQHPRADALLTRNYRSSFVVPNLERL